jgi:hypothetical protein
MPQRRTCPNPACGFSFLTPAETAGQVTSCPQCGTVLVIPRAQPAPASAHGRARLSPAEREDVFRQARSTRWSGTAVTVGLIALVFGLVSWRVSVYLGRLRVREKLLAVCRANGKELDPLVAELAPDLERVVSCANDYLATAEGKSRLHMDNGLRGVIQRLPPATDLEPLFTLTPAATGSYPAAVAVVAARADRDWLLELSCAPDERVRVFAAAALRPSLPLGRCTDEQAARLAERMDAGEKRQLYADIEAAILDELKAAWAGRYGVAIKAEWQSAFGATNPVQWKSGGEPLAVSCQDRTWRVAFRDQVWTGTTDELPEVSLACRVHELLWLKALVPPYSTVRDSVVTLIFDEKEGFRLGAHPVPMYEPPRAMSTPLERKGTLPPDAAIVGTSIQNRGGFPTPVVHWMRPARAGFRSFRVMLVPR